MYIPKLQGFNFFHSDSSPLGFSALFRCARMKISTKRRTIALKIWNDTIPTFPRTTWGEEAIQKPWHPGGAPYGTQVFGDFGDFWSKIDKNCLDALGWPGRQGWRLEESESWLTNTDQQLPACFVAREWWSLHNSCRIQWDCWVVDCPTIGLREHLQETLYSPSIFQGQNS